jgi:hypothetical protein
MTYDVPTADGAEFEDYDEATRQAWSGVLQSGAVMHNSNSKAVFNVSAASINAGFIEGAALVSRNTKGDHTAGDYMLSYSKFGTVIAVVDNDIVNVTVTVTLT